MYTIKINATIIWCRYTVFDCNMQFNCICISKIVFCAFVSWYEEKYLYAFFDSRSLLYTPVLPINIYIYIAERMDKAAEPNKNSKAKFQWKQNQIIRFLFSCAQHVYVNIPIKGLLSNSLLKDFLETELFRLIYP